MTTTMKHVNNKTSLTVLCWNIANPSLERARKQREWLDRHPADLLVLTESKASEGCAFLERSLLAGGFHVAVGRPEPGEYGVMIASRLSIAVSGIAQRMSFLSSRTVSVTLSGVEPSVEVIGVYVPSRDASVEKREKKRRFLEALVEALHRPTDHAYRVLCGDLNILEPDHVPHYSVFESWEYGVFSKLKDLALTDAFRALHPRATEHSWVGRTGDGYRYDHAFVSRSLTTALAECYYDHMPRDHRLSDHSALVLKLQLASTSGPTRLTITPYAPEPAATQTSLF